MRSQFVTLGVGLAVGAALSYFIVTRDASTQRGLETRRAAAAQAAERIEASAESRAERPKAELDLAALRRVVLSQALSAEQAPAPAPAENSLVAARRTLDERMTSAAANPAVTARMERELRAVVDSGALGETSAAVVCGATLCRVDLTGAEESSVNKAAGAFAERLPKTFASAVVYPRGAGERSVYVALTSVDLMLGPPPTNTPASTAGRDEP